MDLFSLINLLMLLLSRKDNDVFLSFSHHDIGKNFGDHLYKDLNSAGIRTLRDDGGIYAGQKSDIKKPIQESRISVVVFSKGYASSTKCLDQLVHIMDARNKTGLVVLPVFYNVDPSEVSEQKGLFEEAFAKHEKSFHKEMARVESWRAALKEAADLAGMVLQQDSFRGKDTRRNFTDHLYKALSREGIPTFRDDDGIRRGENIELEIKKAVQETKLSIIVFSKEYASSRWCLDELEMIMERRRTVGHIVFPVFYDVDPSEVGTQTGRYGEEFAKHEIHFKDRVEGWRKALKEVAYMEGMVLEDGY
ncbi:PREDICTED: TMV resistance protein N-like [Populus euphratica]|uniref:TMV resistance protein N-like n=1 Tax=Populus euphratica TaxID=75702 RepID=A0AAJ6X371_POPEU|nr:PREDICTED: TMV resistance protein N-like [Populus euphratica]